ncbi:MAG: hypothetical protein AAF587_19725 [Bacteroidota bacterium]
MSTLHLDIPSSISFTQSAIFGSLKLETQSTSKIESIQISFKKTIQLVGKKGQLEQHSQNLGQIDWSGKTLISQDKSFSWDFSLPIHISDPKLADLKEEGRLGQILQRLETKLSAEYPSHQLLVKVNLSNGEQIKKTHAVKVRY